MLRRHKVTYYIYSAKVFEEVFVHIVEKIFLLCICAKVHVDIQPIICNFVQRIIL